MPSYDMACSKCGHEFEVFRPGFMRDEDKVCPKCGSTEVEQAMTGFLTYFGSSSGKSNCGPRMDSNKTAGTSAAYSRWRKS